MDSIEHILRATPLPENLPNDNNDGQNHRRALVHASLATAVGRKGRHLSGTFCLTGDTMEGIIQCLVFLKAFSVSFLMHTFFFFVSHSLPQTISFLPFSFTFTFSEKIWIGHLEKKTTLFIDFWDNQLPIQCSQCNTEKKTESKQDKKAC